MDLRKNRKVKLGSISNLQIQFVLPDFPSDKMLDSYGEYDYKPQTISIIQNLINLILLQITDPVNMFLM